MYNATFLRDWNKWFTSDQRRGQVPIRRGILEHLFQTSQRGVLSQVEERNLRVYEERKMWFKRCDDLQVGISFLQLFGLDYNINIKSKIAEFMTCYVVCAIIIIIIIIII